MNDTQQRLQQIGNALSLAPLSPAQSRWLLDQVEKLRAAAKAILPFLEHSQDVRAEPAIFVPSAERLRRAANALEAKDRAVEQLRAALGETKEAKP